MQTFEYLLFNAAMVAFGDIKDVVMSHGNFNKVNSRLDKHYIKLVVECWGWCYSLIS